MVHGLCLVRSGVPHDYQTPSQELDLSTNRDVRQPARCSSFQSDWSKLVPWPAGRKLTSHLVEAELQSPLSDMTKMGILLDPPRLRLSHMVPAWTLSLKKVPL